MKITILLIAVVQVVDGFLAMPSIARFHSALYGFHSALYGMQGDGDGESSAGWSRRKLLGILPAIAAAPIALAPFPSIALVPTGPSDGLLPDLPSEAVRSYLQYRAILQTSADFYLFDLQNLIGDVDEWGEVGQLFRVNQNRGQGSPSRIERDFVNPMRILGLSMPPDAAEAMRESQFKFEKAANKIGKATAGIRRDLPVEIDRNSLANAKAGWDEGRLAINEFFGTVNEVTGLNELKYIPPTGPDQFKDYGRSSRKYFDLKKKTKLCQNRGGPTLSQAWGGLMVSGYMQDSCGIPDADEYFFQ